MRTLCIAVLLVLVALRPDAEAKSPSRLQISATTDAGSDRAMNTRAAVFRACFTKELNRTPSLRDHVSTLVLHISVRKGSADVPVFDEQKSVNADNVKSCVALTIKRLEFPATASELDYTLTYTP